MNNTLEPLTQIKDLRKVNNFKKLFEDKSEITEISADKSKVIDSCCKDKKLKTNAIYVLQLVRHKNSSKKYIFLERKQLKFVKRCCGNGTKDKQMIALLLPQKGFTLFCEWLDT